MILSIPNDADKGWFEFSKHKLQSILNKRNKLLF